MSAGLQHSNTLWLSGTSRPFVALPFLFYIHLPPCQKSAVLELQDLPHLCPPTVGSTSVLGASPCCRWFHRVAAHVRFSGWTSWTEAWPQDTCWQVPRPGLAPGRGPGHKVMGLSKCRVLIAFSLDPHKCALADATREPVVPNRSLR